MKAMPPEERAFGPFPRRDDAILSRSQSTLQVRSHLPSLSTKELRTEAEPFRSVRAPLRDLLDEEFQKNYRFEGISDFSQYLKGLWRNFVVRDDSDEEYGEFLAGREVHSITDPSPSGE